MTDRKETLPPKPTSHAGAVGMLRAMQCTDGAFGTCPMCGGVVADRNDEDSLPVHKPGCILKAALDAGPSFDFAEYLVTLIETAQRVYGRSSKVDVLHNIAREHDTLLWSTGNAVSAWTRIAMLALEGALRAGDATPETIIEHLVSELANKIGQGFAKRRARIVLLDEVEVSGGASGETMRSPPTDM